MAKPPHIHPSCSHEGCHATERPATPTSATLNPLRPPAPTASFGSAHVVFDEKVKVCPGPRIMVTGSTGPGIVKSRTSRVRLAPQPNSEPMMAPQRRPDAMSRFDFGEGLT